MWVEKATRRFGCEQVTFVGDRGMIKKAQIEDWQNTDFHYITTLTKKQIETLLQKGVIQYELFDDTVCEIEDGSVRYIFRRNPIRVREIRENRESKKTFNRGYGRKAEQISSGALACQRNNRTQTSYRKN